MESAADYDIRKLGEASIVSPFLGDDAIDLSESAFVDANNDDNLSAAELSGRGGSRSAMGGFLKGHSKEIDRDRDGILTRSEAVGNAERMFAKMDLKGDGRITPDEMEKSRRE